MSSNTQLLPDLCPLCGWQDDIVFGNHELTKAPGPAVVIVEQRDEVFARLGTDLAEIGLRVYRASTIVEAVRLGIRCAPRLVLVNLDLPNDQGWEQLNPLCLLSPTFRVWVYKARKSVSDCTMARAYRVDEVIHYRGDLLDLADAVMECLSGQPGRRPRYNVATDSYIAEAAA